LLVSKDGRSIAIAAFNKQFLNDNEKDFILDNIRKKIEELKFDEFHLTAKIRIERIYVKEIEKNLKIYLLISLMLISFVLFILFKSLKTIVILLLTIGVSIAWTLSFIALDRTFA
jgi:predicted RND superfamily exporter protein